jgi:hypothetical protein
VGEQVSECMWMESEMSQQRVPACVGTYTRMHTHKDNLHVPLLIFAPACPLPPPPPPFAHTHTHTLLHSYIPVKGLPYLSYSRRG